MTAKKIKEKLSSSIARELEQKILRKEFMAEQPLPSEARLCEYFGVSRTVIREAIQQLKSYGIIHSVTGSGNYVSKNNTSDLKRNITLLAKLNEGTKLYHEILQLRELLELDCIKMACHNSTPELVKNLRSHIKTMAESHHDFDAFAKADHAFHLEIMKASGNELFCAILESMYENFLQVSRKIYEVKGAITRVTREHRLILQAISKKDEQEAVKLLGQHIQHTKDGI